MKKFRVDVWEEVTYTKIFEAETKEQAEDIEKIKYEEAKKDLTKYLSHDIGRIMKEKLNFSKRRG